MSHTANLKAGEKIRILLDDNGKDIEFVSRVEELIGEDGFVASKPISADIYRRLPLGRIVKVELFREDGVYYFAAQAVEMVKSRETFSVMMNILSDKHRLQRRNFYRLKTLTALKISWKIHGSDMHMGCDAIDISGGGVKILSFKKIDAGTSLKMFIRIPGLEGRELSGRVVRCSHSAKNESAFEIGVEFTDMDSASEDTILKYIFKEQREMIKKARAIEDDLWRRDR